MLHSQVCLCYKRRFLLLAICPAVGKVGPQSQPNEYCAFRTYGRALKFSALRQAYLCLCCASRFAGDFVDGFEAYGDEVFSCFYLFFYVEAPWSEHVVCFADFYIIYPYGGESV